MGQFLYQYLTTLIVGAYVIVLSSFIFQATKSRKGWVVLEIFGMGVLNLILTFAISDNLLIGALDRCDLADASLMAAVMIVFTFLCAMCAQKISHQLNLLGWKRWLIQLVNLPQYLCWGASIILWTTCKPGGAG